MIYAVILAAGISSRLGTPKQLLSYQGRPLVAHVVDTICRTGVEKVFVVLGHRAEEVRETLKEYDVNFVHNPDYASGQSTSLRAGLNALGDSAGAALFVLGDQPLLKPRTVNRIIEEYRLGGKGIVAPFYRGKRGNPVLFNKKYFPEIFALTGDTGARKIIEFNKNQLARVDVDDAGVVFDIDTWEDYSKLIKFEQGVGFIE
ncbi:molybdenum cofactor cytidylyltransferase [Desulfoscipio gibsoniae]|uniref:Molybdenum hydroxylase accessory protein, YgfJ family n=1 Tax=Desulfoscipio gibsoniae DSM 7213 TaxID=767817 RepID=R4KUE8_9FIRM|nr:molybdenum cofactor cytidylyltransferase [Desulfoscipio gibsoniae]AGL03251.1 molybdenum hydroxylase accessory protein, YgfJ family [Desulfoscipio gibsoniae DSM 7213]